MHCLISFLLEPHTTLNYENRTSGTHIWMVHSIQAKKVSQRKDETRIVQERWWHFC